MAEADETADRLRRESERVAQAALLAVTSEECRRQKEEAALALTAARAGREEAEREWRALWSATPVTPGTPREMRAWLTRCTDALRLLEEARTATSAAEQAEQAMQRQAASLRAGLASYGVQPPATEGLSALTDRAVLVLERLDAGQLRRCEQKAAVERLAREAEKLARADESARAELAAWDAQWLLALAPLALSHRPSAAEARSLLRQLELGLQHRRTAEESQARVAEMERSVAGFEAEVAALAQAAGGDLASEPAVSVVRKLASQLTAARKAETQRDGLQVRISEEEEALAEAQRAIVRAQEDLQKVLAASGCEMVEALPAIEALSARRHELIREERELRRTLTLLQPGGTDPDALVSELQAVDFDQFTEAHAQMKERSQLAEQAKEERVREQLECESALRAMDGGDGAALAEAEAQQAAAEIEALAIRYLRLRLARQILQRQIDRYRDENEGPVIKRAHELFPRLTHGSFAGLKTGFDEKGRPVLLGVRPSGEEVPVAGMSEGTRDQLFLALRLASLEQQMTDCEPVPLVLDDILISFDDQRALDTLGVLAKFCTRTQVLLFTHHAHVVELARQAVPAALLQLHRLKRPTAPTAPREE